MTQCNLLSITYKVLTDAFYHITLNNTIKLSSKTVHDTPTPPRNPPLPNFHWCIPLRYTSPANRKA